MNYTYRNQPLTDKEKQALETAFKEYDQEHNVIYPPEIPLSILAYDKDKLIGAAVGRIWANWLYISDLWVAKDYRQQGIAKKLLHDLETEAKKHHVIGSHTWTASYNAPDFYQKHGYELALELKDKPLGYSSFVCRKYF